MKYRYTTRLVKKLANLQLAITLLFTIGLTISVGTIIEQDQNLAFYKENYPLNKPLFGFLNWKFIKIKDSKGYHFNWNNRLNISGER
jgi:cytochrome c biogenesis protein